MKFIQKLIHETLNIITINDKEEIETIKLKISLMIFEVIKFYNIYICENLIKNKKKILTLRDVRSIVAYIT